MLYALSAVRCAPADVASLRMKQPASRDYVFQEFGEVTKDCQSSNLDNCSFSLYLTLKLLTNENYTKTNFLMFKNLLIKESPLTGLIRTQILLHFICESYFAKYT